MRKPSESLTDSRNESLFTHEEKLALADVLGDLGMHFKIETVSDGEMIDELDELRAVANKMGYFVKSETLCRLYEKVQKIKKQMMEALKAGPLIDLPLAGSEQLSHYLSRCSRERRRFPLTVRAEAVRRELLTGDTDEELAELDIVNYGGRENLRISEKLIDCKSFLKEFLGLPERIDLAVTQDLLSSAIVGKPLSPSVRATLHVIFSSVDQEMINDDRTRETLKSLLSVITSYLQKLRGNGAIRKKPSASVFADLQVEIARKLGNIGLA
jgi:hypothetical protein